jgi:signal transduction histidine kinase
MSAPADARATGLARLRVAYVLGFATLLPLVVVGVAIAVGIIALAHQSSVRDELVNRVQPAALAAQSLETGLLNQETGVRGYELSAMPSFLAPYHLGRRQERQALAQLRRSSVIGSGAALAQATGRIDAWRHQVASLAIAGVTPGHPHATATVDAVVGKHLFDQVRTSLAVLQRDINSRASTVKHELDSAARTSVITFIAIGVALLVSVIVAALTLRRTVTKPLEELTDSSRVVAQGELSQSLLVDGPLEIAQLGRDVDAMRQRLVRELEALQAAHSQLGETADELERSNAELEQFAYVASHDLQEPLRKVTSFCQMLQDRYSGQLDARADQYIEFAVDGAKRMQQLINDLLAFSRVGRVAQSRELVDLNAVAQAALDDLDEALAAAQARVMVDDLPRLSVQATLIRVVFQNLIGNAIKFHSGATPEVRIAATEREHDWLFECTDNGIGIEPEYAERIFVIFQRLHARDHYEGTGIGLAMCRKIVEYHGGRIWLDTEYAGGTRICFTLPAREHSDTMVA